MRRHHEAKLVAILSMACGLFPTEATAARLDLGAFIGVRFGKRVGFEGGAEVLMTQPMAGETGIGAVSRWTVGPGKSMISMGAHGGVSADTMSMGAEIGVSTCPAGACFVGGAN